MGNRAPSEGSVRTAIVSCTDVLRWEAYRARRLAAGRYREALAAIGAGASPGAEKELAEALAAYAVAIRAVDDLEDTSPEATV